MLRYLWLFLALCLTGVSLAEQPKGAEVDWTEIARWGDRVVVSGEGPQAVDDLLFTMAMAPPHDDSDMWYITVWGMKNCTGCKMLHTAFEKDDNLTPFIAVPPGGKKAWAHYNEYIWEDPTQKWRFKDFKTEAGPFPIITIQPPRNKVFGDPRIVVDRIEARDWRDTASLKKRITGSVEKYCKKLKDSGYIPPAHAIEKHGFVDPSNLGVKLINISGESYGHGQKPADVKDPVITGPWGPDPPTPQPFNPQYPQFPPTGPTQQPSFPATGGGGFFDGLLSPESGTFFLLIIAALRLFEIVGPLFGFDTGLIKRLRELAEKAKPPAPAFVQEIQSPPISVMQPQPAGVAPGFLMLTNGQIVATPK